MQSQLAVQCEEQTYGYWLEPILTFFRLISARLFIVEGGQPENPEKKASEQGEHQQ